MKKLTLISIVFIAFCFKVNGQNAYYDAITLKVYQDSIKNIYPQKSRTSAKNTLFDFLESKRILSKKEFDEIPKFLKKPFAKTDVLIENISHLESTFQLYHIFNKYQTQINDSVSVSNKTIKSIIDTLDSELKHLQKNGNTTLFEYKTNTNSTDIIGFSDLKEKLKNGKYVFLKKRGILNNVAEDSLTNITFEKAKNTVKEAQAKIKSIEDKADNDLQEMVDIRLSLMDSIIIKTPNLKQKVDKILETSIELGSNMSTIASNKVINAQQLQSSGMSLDLTTRLVDATARFLVKRTKEELTLAFFDKLREKLDTIPELKAFFPATYLLLQNNENINRLPSMSNTWVAAFHADIVQIPNNLERYMNVYHPEVTNEDGFKIFMITYHSFELLEKGTHPAVLFDFLKTRFANDNDIKSSEVSRTIRLLNLLSNNLLDSAGTDTVVWIKPAKALKQFANPVFRKYFLGLLYQKDPLLFDNLRIKTDDSQTFADWLNQEKNFDYLNQTISQLLIFFDDIQKQINVYKKQPPLKDVKPFLHYTQSIFDGINLGFQLKYLIKNGNPDKVYYECDFYQKWLPIANSSIEAIKSFYLKDYGSGFLHTLQVVKPIWMMTTKKKTNSENDLEGLKLVENIKINDLIDKISSTKTELITAQNKLNDNLAKLKSDFKVDSIRSQYIKLISKNMSELKNLNIELKNLQSLKERFDEIEKRVTNASFNIQNNANESILNQKIIDRNIDLFDQFAHYANFLNDVISADSTTDLRDVINKYAEPVGSYSIKRKNRFSLDLNAYPGLFGGFENPIASGNDNNTRALSNKSNFVSGITAPIGISLSWGKKRNCAFGKSENNVKNGHSLSIFIPVVDIGAAFSYRWTNDTLSGLPEIKLSQILTPGLFLIWGLKNMPIAIMAGVQITPKLREVNIYDATTKKYSNDTAEINMVRFGITASVDIPIFNLYNRRRKIEKE
jgi:hypothetical protein